MTIEAFDAVDVIRAKRDRQPIAEDALRWMIDAYTREYVTDAQMASFAMAVLLNGMTRDEIRVMTDAMIASGERMSFTGLLADYGGSMAFSVSSVTLGASGTELRCWMATDTAESPSKGRRPVSIS